MRFFVTGASGCIGGWVVKNLVETGHEVFALVRSGSLDKLRLIMPERDIAKVHVVKGDILDAELIHRSVAGVDRVIHLAAMQLPFCKADPVLGSQVNVTGTVHIFEAAKACGLDRVVYSSTTAVYGNASEYPGGTFGHTSPLITHSHYGTYKIANEWSARVYYESDGINSIGIRPFVVYGPLRDQGMTSTPTAAMKAAAEGKPYHISYGGRFEFQLADDTAKAFIQAALADYRGAEVFNLGGGNVTMDDVVRCIELAAPEVKGRITYEDESLPFPAHDEGDKALECAVGAIPWTSLEAGVRKTIEIFRAGNP